MSATPLALPLVVDEVGHLHQGRILGAEKKLTDDALGGRLDAGEWDRFGADVIWAGQAECQVEGRRCTRCRLLALYCQAGRTAARVRAVVVR